MMTWLESCYTAVRAPRSHILGRVSGTKESRPIVCCRRRKDVIDRRRRDVDCRVT